MTKNKQRRPSTPPGVRVRQLPGDSVPTVALDAGQVTAILNFQIVLAGPLAFGTGDIRGDYSVHPKLESLGAAVAEDFRTLMHAVAKHLGAEIVDLGEFTPADGGPPTVVSTKGGRA